MNENDWEKWYEGNEAMEEEVAEECAKWVQVSLKDCGETIEARMFEAKDEGLITDLASAQRYRRRIVEALKKRAERRFYRALEEGKIIL